MGLFSIQKGPSFVLIKEGTCIPSISFPPLTYTHTHACSPPPSSSPRHLHITIASQLRGLGQIADLQLRPVLREDAVAVVLPELLRGVLAAHALQDLGPTWMLVEEV